MTRRPVMQAHRHSISLPEWCVAAGVVLAWAVGLGWTPW